MLRREVVMGYSSYKWIWLAAFAVVVPASFLGCGDEDGGELAPELFGTWDLISLEAEGMSTDCPGEIVLSETESVSCGTESITLNSDGTLIDIETTDELGDPYDYRTEGTWSTAGSTLTLTYTAEGPDEDNLQPIDPPQVETSTWSLTGTTLTVSIPSPPPGSVTVVATLEKR
jgi:hypothetical protein